MEHPVLERRDALQALGLRPVPQSASERRGGVAAEVVAVMAVDALQQEPDLNLL